MASRVAAHRGPSCTAAFCTCWDCTVLYRAGLGHAGAVTAALRAAAAEWVEEIGERRRRDGVPLLILLVVTTGHCQATAHLTTASRATVRAVAHGGTEGSSGSQGKEMLLIMRGGGGLYWS